jgi:hypothetical protein
VTKPKLTLDPRPGDPHVGRMLAALEDTRRRTLGELKGVTAQDVDRTATGRPNTIGTILYHLALIEADWVFVEILGEPDSIPADLFPHEDREQDGVLTPVFGLTLDEHLERLAAVRSILLERVSALSSNDLDRPRELDDYHVSPAWVLHHLSQHEAEHRSEIGALRTG